ncbi:fibrous sheath-interacting protein 2-like [Orbicella faveolata]|uniref:fibrous sheath-interacting protein 2-like n=1 Tax=Orbicella faveolata TaxID=48498 RepID=UPI0009E2B802|nr:fibrous sheath-interacting protein 2-like [Orbicella faveolata]
MDAMAYMFSVARANSSNVLEFNPECIMQEDLMSLSSKFPLIPGSQRSITFCTTCLSQKLREMPTDADFDLTDPYSPPPRYNVLHDPHLKEYFQNQAMRRRLVEKGFITNSGYVKCTLLEFNMFRQWLRKLKLDRVHQQRRRERQMEIQLWKERQAREQLLRDEELYSSVREREQKARDLKERGAKRRELDRRKYLKLQEIDRKRREKFEEEKRRERDLNESLREKNLATKQEEKVKEEEKVRRKF